MRTYLEITTQIGCRVACMKYCCQEHYTKQYSNMLPLSLDGFKVLLSTVPKDVVISFAGISEPLQNQDAPDMILYAHEEGYSVQVYTTLTGLSSFDASRICKVPFDSFTLHLPDSYGISKVPRTDEYLHSLDIILRNVERLNFMSMGYTFVSDGREKRIREGGPVILKGRVKCERHDEPVYFMLPNGDTYFCCVADGSEAMLGNLYSDSFKTISKRLCEVLPTFQTNNKSICHKCSYAKWHWHYELLKLARGPLLELKKKVV